MKILQENTYRSSREVSDFTIAKQPSGNIIERKNKRKYHTLLI
jgi:hypothetical protein